MSVGIRRIREDPEAIRKGCRDKGEDPSLVDRALVLDARVRELRTLRDQARAERKQAARDYYQRLKEQRP